MITPELIAELVTAFQWYVDEDNTIEGDNRPNGGLNWDEENAYWIAGRNRAMALLERFKETSDCPTPPDYFVMLDQVIQAGLTLQQCWFERTSLSIEDDPYVEDAISTIRSVQSELKEYDTALRKSLALRP